MKEYIKEQLEEQIGKMIDDFASGDFNQVEQRFGAVENFILRDEKTFIEGIRDEEKEREKQMREIREKFIKAIETALEHETTDDKVVAIVQAFDTLHGTEQAVMSKYINDLVESVVSYKRKILDNDGKPVSRPPIKTPDEIDSFLDKK